MNSDGTEAPDNWSPKIGFLKLMHRVSNIPSRVNLNRFKSFEGEVFMKKFLVLGISLMGLMGSTVHATVPTKVGACEKTGVIHDLSCIAHGRGGYSVQTCNVMGKGLYADVYSTGPGDRPYVLSSFAVKVIKTGTVGGSSRYVDKKTRGKTFELKVTYGTAPINGGRPAVLEINGEVLETELGCRQLRG